MQNRKRRILGIIFAVIAFSAILTACTVKKQNKEPEPEEVDSVSVVESIYKSMGSATISTGIFYNLQFNGESKGKKQVMTFKAGGDALDNKNSKMLFEMREEGKELPDFGIYYENETFYFDVAGSKFYISDFNLSKILGLANGVGTLLFDVSSGRAILGILLGGSIGQTMTVLEKNGVQYISTTLLYSNIKKTISQILPYVFPGEDSLINYDDITKIPGITASLKDIMNDELKETILKSLDFLPEGGADFSAIIDNGVLTKFNIDGETFKTDAVTCSLSTYNSTDKANIASSMPEFVTYTKFDFAVYEFVAELKIKDLNLLAVVQLNLDIKNNDKNKIVIDIKDKVTNNTLLKLFYLNGSIYIDATNAIDDIALIDLSNIGLPKLRVDDAFDLASILNNLVGDMLEKVMTFVGVNRADIAPVAINMVSDTGETTTTIDVNYIITAILSNMKFEDGKLNLHLENETIKGIISKLLKVENVAAGDIIDILDVLSKDTSIDAGRLVDALLGRVGYSIERILNGIGIDGVFSIVEKQPSLGIDVIFEKELFGGISLALTQMGSIKVALPILTDEEKAEYKTYKKPSSTHFGTTLTIPNTPFTLQFMADIDIMTGANSMLRGTLLYNDGKKTGSIKFVVETANGEIFLDFTNFRSLLPASINLDGLGFPMMRIKLSQSGGGDVGGGAGGEMEDITDKLIAVIGELISSIGYDEASGILDLTFTESGLAKVLLAFGIDLTKIDETLAGLIGEDVLAIIVDVLGASIYNTIKELMPVILTISKDNGLNVDIVAGDIKIANFSNMSIKFDEAIVFEDKEKYTLLTEPESAHFGTTLTIPNTPFTLEFTADIDIMTGANTLLKGVLKYNDGIATGSINFVVETGNGEIFLDFTNFKHLLPTTIHLEGLGFPMMRIKLGSEIGGGGEVGGGGEADNNRDKIVAIIGELISSMVYDKENGILDMTFTESGITNILKVLGFDFSKIDEALAGLIGEDVLGAITTILGSNVYDILKTLMPIVVAVSNNNGMNIDISIAKDINIANFKNFSLGFNDKFVFEDKDKYKLVDVPKTEWLSVATEGKVTLTVSDAGNAILRSIINKLVGVDSFLGKVDIAVGSQPLNLDISFALGLNLKDLAKSQLKVNLAITTADKYQFIFEISMDGDTIYVDLKGEKTKGIKVKLIGTDLFGQSPAEYYSSLYSSATSNSTIGFAMEQVVLDEKSIMDKIIGNVFEILGIENVLENQPTIKYVVENNKINITAGLGDKIIFNGLLNKLTANYAPVLSISEEAKLTYLPITMNAGENILTMLPVIIPMIVPDFAVSFLKNASEGDGSMNNASVDRMESHGNGFRIYLDPNVPISVILFTINPKFSIEITGYGVAIKLVELQLSGIINVSDILITELTFESLFGTSGSNTPPVYDKTTGQIGQASYPSIGQDDIDRLVAPLVENNGYIEKTNTFTFKPLDDKAKTLVDYDIRVLYPNRKVFSSVTNRVTDTLRDDAYKTLAIKSHIVNADGSISVTFNDREINLLETYEIQVRTKAQKGNKKAASLWSGVRFDDAGGLIITNTDITNTGADDLSLKMSFDALMLQKLLDNVQANLVAGMLEGVGQYNLAAKFRDGYAHYGTGLDNGFVDAIFQYLKSDPSISSTIGLLNATNVKQLIASVLPFGRMVDVAYLSLSIKGGELQNLTFAGGVSDGKGGVITNGSNTSNILYTGRAECLSIGLNTKTGIDISGITEIQTLASSIYSADNLNSIKWENGKFLPPVEFLDVTFANGKKAQAKVLWNMNDIDKIKVVIGEKREYVVRYQVAGVAKTHNVIIDGTFGFDAITSIEIEEQKLLEVYPFTDSRTEKMLPSTVNIKINGTLTVPCPVNWDLSGVNFGLSGGTYKATAEIETVNGMYVAETPILVKDVKITSGTMLPNGASGDYSTNGLVLPIDSATRINVDVHKPLLFSAYMLLTLSDGTTVVAGGEWDISKLVYNSIGGEYEVTFAPKYFLKKYDNGETIWVEKDYPTITYIASVVEHKVKAIDGFTKEGNNLVLYINDSRDKDGLLNELKKMSRNVTFVAGAVDCVTSLDLVWGNGLSALGWTFVPGRMDQYGDVIVERGFTGKNTYGITGGTYEVELKINDITITNVSIKVRGMSVSKVEGFTDMKTYVDNPFSKGFMAQFKNKITGTVKNNDAIEETKEFTAKWDLSALEAEKDKVFGLGGKKYTVKLTLSDGDIVYPTVDITIEFPDVLGKTFTLHYNDENKTELKELLLNPKDSKFTEKIPRDILIKDGTDYYAIENIAWINEKGIAYDSFDDLIEVEADYQFIYELGFEDKIVSFTLTVKTVAAASFTVGETKYKTTGDKIFINPYTAQESIKWNGAKFYDTEGNWLFDMDIVWDLNGGNLKDTAGQSINATYLVDFTMQTLELNIVVYKATFEGILVDDSEVANGKFAIDPLASANVKLPKNFTVRYLLSDTDDATADIVYDKVMTDYVWSFTADESAKLINFKDDNITFTKAIKPHGFGDDIMFTFDMTQYGTLDTSSVTKNFINTVGTTFTTKTETPSLNFSVKNGVTVSVTWNAGTGITSNGYATKTGTIHFEKNGVKLADDETFTVVYTTLLISNRISVAGGTGNNTVYYNASGNKVEGVFVAPTSAKMLYKDGETIANMDVNIFPDKDISAVGSNVTINFNYTYTATIGDVAYAGTFPAQIRGMEQFSTSGWIDGNTSNPLTRWKNTSTEDATYTMNLNNPTTFLASSFPVLYVKKYTSFSYQVTPNLNYKVIADFILAKLEGQLGSVVDTLDVSSGIRMYKRTARNIGAWVNVDNTVLKVSITNSQE